MKTQLQTFTQLKSQELESINGGVDPLTAISFSIAVAKGIYDLCYIGGNTYYNLTHQIEHLISIGEMKS